MEKGVATAVTVGMEHKTASIIRSHWDDDTVQWMWPVGDEVRLLLVCMVLVLSFELGKGRSCRLSIDFYDDGPKG